MMLSSFVVLHVHDSDMDVNFKILLIRVIEILNAKSLFAIISRKYL